MVCGQRADDFEFVLPPAAVPGIFIAALAWLGCVFVYLSTRRWRRLLSCFVLPITILAALKPLGHALDAIHGFMRSGSLEKAAAQSGLASGQRFAFCEIAQGGFVPLPTYLIYDESNRRGLAHTTAGALAETALVSGRISRSRCQIKGRIFVV